MQKDIAIAEKQHFMNNSLIPKIQLSQSQISLQKNLACKFVIYENRIFNVKRKFIVPKLQVFRLRLKTQDFQSTKDKPQKDFSSFIDNLQRNRALLRRGAFDMPIESTFSKKKLIKLKTEEITNQQLIQKHKSKIFNNAPFQKNICLYQSKQSISRHRYFNADTSTQNNLISDSQRESIVPKIQKIGIQSFRARKMSEKQQSIKRRNSIYRKLGVQLIQNQLMRRSTQSCK